MKILLLPNSLKGSISARQTARVLQQTLSQKHTIWAYPLSDGGDGFIDFFMGLYPQARLVSCQAQNAFGVVKHTSYLWLASQQIAVLETARICGLGRVPKEELNPLGATSFGVGQVIKSAIKKGAKKIYIGLGGVACNDGGAGLLQALGAQLIDVDGKELSPGAKPLLRLEKIHLASVQSCLRGIKLYAIADVINPLLGARGSARIFGPQKGATPAQVKTLEKALKNYSRILQQAARKPISSVASTGAAGAICAGLYGGCGAKIVLGADFLRAHLPLAKLAKWADLIITSEGKLDAQTLFGKAPLAALQTAAKYHKPILFVCGQVEYRALHHLPKGLNLQIICLADYARNIQESQRYAARYLRKIALVL